MSSFYGGRTGASCVIVKSYETISAMNADATHINYGCYVYTEEGNGLWRKETNNFVRVATMTPSGGGGGTVTWTDVF